MIDLEARREVESLELGQGSHAMMIEWTDTVPPPAAPQAKTRRERLEELERQLHERKQPLLERLAATEGVEVQDLTALPQAIVRTDASGWARLAREGGLLDREPGVRLVPSHLYQALSRRT